VNKIQINLFTFFLKNPSFRKHPLHILPGILKKALCFLFFSFLFQIIILIILKEMVKIKTKLVILNQSQIRYSHETFFSLENYFTIIS